MNLSRQEAAEQTRQKLVVAALDIVGESGYEALTTNSLIGRAGVAKGTLYHHFNNLDQVVYAMIQMILDKTLDDVPVEQYDNIADYLEALGNFIICDFITDKRVMKAVFGFLPKGMNDPFFRTVALEILESACNRIAPAIQQFYGGKLTDTKIDHAIRMVDMFSAGFCIHYVIFDDEDTYRAIWKEFSQMLTSYLEP